MQGLCLRALHEVDAVVGGNEVEEDGSGEEAVVYVDRVRYNAYIRDGGHRSFNISLFTRSHLTRISTRWFVGI
jgi:hypothetical protein